MNPIQIEYFMAVAHWASFTTAANEIHVSQPAVSKQIISLERELGAPLFVRAPKGLDLTPQGKLCHDFFTRQKAELEALKKEILAMSAGQKELARSVKIIFFHDWDSDLFVAPFMERINEEAPNVYVDFELRKIFDISKTLLDNDYDMLISYNHLIPANLRKNLDGFHLKDVRQMAFISNRHPLAKKENLSFADLKDEPCIMLRDEKYKEPLETAKRICFKYGFEPEFIFKSDHESVVMYAQAGNGFCIFDEWSRNRWQTRFKCIPIDYFCPVSVFQRKGCAADYTEKIYRLLKSLAAKTSQPQED